ncbi:proton-conducting transporter transmembrane domain-containing protein [Haloplanus natans]|uniref:proton-conducting transporter transmembrane domain-containing protein n=1 Tax=Haloplanus natans TaxID=376171 RepID=UPI0006782795|nr:proton-conducting transporter membrane subunit [Haloplanus natans]
MTDALVPLLVAVPLLGALFVVAAGLVSERGPPAVTALVLVAQTALAGWIGSRALLTGELSNAVGGFVAPYGIELVVDGLSAVVVVLVAVVSLAVLVYTVHDDPGGTAFYTEYLLLVTGLTGMSVTGDVFNLYVFLEISGLATYALVASAGTGRSAVSALKYLLFGTVAASLYLLGVGYALVATGTLNMADLSVKLAQVGYDSPLVLASFGFVVVGLATKTALFPLHTWQPDAYNDSPDSVSALISALVSTVAAYALLRIVYTVYTPAFFEAVPVARDALVLFACVSIVVGSILAVAQSEVKRMLAYSSVSQYGLVVVGLAIGTRAAVFGAIVHLVGHAIMKGGLFVAAGTVDDLTGATTVEGYAGLADRFPVLGGASAVLMLAMVGVPPAVGFAGKWYIALGAVRAGVWPVAVVIFASTLLTLAYFAILVERMFVAPASPSVRAATDGGAERLGGAATPPRRLLVLVVGAAVVAVALGFAVTGLETALEPTLDTLLS